MAGGLAPPPEQFPLTEEGKREYYAAVQRAADHIAMQHMAMHHHLAATQAQYSAADAERVRRRRHLLLIRR